MPLPNLNKLFPRLTIRTKLAIAFVVVAALPLLAVAAVTVATTIQRLRGIAEASVLHDLESVVRDARQALDYLERDVEYLGGELLRADVAAGVPRFLARSPALFRLRIVASDGGVVRSVTAGAGASEPEEDASALYYVVRARNLRPTEHLVLPVEVRSPFSGAEVPVSAIAVVIPMTGGPEGEAVIVGEAFADQLFSELSTGSALVSGTSLLVDSTGMVLYRSDRPAAWQRGFVDDLGEATRAAIAAHRSRTTELQRSGDFHIGQVDLPLGPGPAAPRLALIRAVSVSTLNEPVRGFLAAVGLSGGVILVLVLGLAYLAAGEFTRPIYALSSAARHLAAGGRPTPVTVESNDEIEDLAVDFQHMATALDRHRLDLERLIDERTRALQQTHAELASVLSHAADAIVVLGPDGRVRLWNRGAEQLFGWPAPEAIGRSGDALLLPEGEVATTESAFIARELAGVGAVVNLPTRRRHRSGELLQVSLTQSAMRNEDGSAHGQVLILRDASLQARLEAQLRRSERLAAVSVMAAGLAHELNNPLAILGNRLEVMQVELDDAPDPDRLRRDLQVMGAHVARLSALTRDLLRFAREDDDPVRPVPLDQLVHQTAALLERTLLARDVTVELDLADALPPVGVRPRAVETVLLNLLLNAADAISGGGRITVRSGLSARPGWAEVAVVDDGPGVAADLHARIFEPFFTTKMPGKGTGLGLAVCRSIVESHGGELTVANHPGRGACFTLTLPVATDTE